VKTELSALYDMLVVQPVAVPQLLLVSYCQHVIQSVLLADVLEVLVGEPLPPLVLAPGEGPHVEAVLPLPVASVEHAHHGKVPFVPQSFGIFIS
jgi:hypothetical protein